MAILVRCACGSKISAPSKYRGRTVACPSCGESLKISESLTAAIDPKELIIFECPCGKRLKAKKKAAGRTTKCPKCGAPVTVPGVDPVSPEPPGLDEDASSSSIFDDHVGVEGGGTDISGLLDEIGAHECKTNRRCPNCKEDMERDDVLCIQCGYNTKTKKILGAEKESRGSAILSSVKNMLTD